MALEKYHIYRNYYKILNKALIRNKIFHFIFTALDTVILTIKLLDIYHTNYSGNTNKSINYLKPDYYFSNYSTMIYLVLEYTFSIVYTMIRDYKKCNRKHDIAFVNIFFYSIYFYFLLRISFQSKFIIFSIIFIFVNSFDYFYYYRHDYFSFDWLYAKNY